jgi:hypothetical protein
LGHGGPVRPLVSYDDDGNPDWMLPDDAWLLWLARSRNVWMGVKEGQIMHGWSGLPGIASHYHIGIVYYVHEMYESHLLIALFSHDGSHFVGGDVGCVGAVLQLFLLLVLLLLQQVAVGLVCCLPGPHAMR